MEAARVADLAPGSARERQSRAVAGGSPGPCSGSVGAVWHLLGALSGQRQQGVSWWPSNAGLTSLPSPLHGLLEREPCRPSFRSHTGWPPEKGVETRSLHLCEKHVLFSLHSWVCKGLSVFYKFGAWLSATEIQARQQWMSVTDQWNKITTTDPIPLLIINWAAHGERFFYVTTSLFHSKHLEIWHF